MEVRIQLDTESKGQKSNWRKDLTNIALSSQESLEDTINCLSEHISLKTEGAFDVKSLFQILGYSS